MTVPADRVRVAKFESPSTGGTQDDMMHPARLDPNEDAPSVRGIFYQTTGPGEDETVYDTRDGANRIFRDPNTHLGAELTLRNLHVGHGLDRHYAESTAESQVTGTTWTQKVRLTFTPPEEANYIIRFAAQLSQSNINTLTLARLQLDDTLTYSSVAVNSGLATYGAGLYLPYAGEFRVNLTVASHNFDLDFAAETAGRTAYIKEANICAERWVEP